MDSFEERQLQLNSVYESCNDNKRIVKRTKIGLYSVVRAAEISSWIQGWSYVYIVDQYEYLGDFVKRSKRANDMTLVQIICKKARQEISQCLSDE